MALIKCLARNNVPTASFTPAKPSRNPAWQMRGIFQGHLTHTHVRFSFFRLVPLSFLTRAFWYLKYECFFMVVCRRARVAQRWEHTHLTNLARVQTPASMPYVGWVSYLSSPLLQEVFLRVFRFSLLIKNQHFQIPIRSWTREHIINELLRTF